MHRLLIDPRDLAPALDDPTLRLLDTRPAPAFAAGHIPGAAHLDVFGISLIDTSPAPLAAFEWIIRHLLELRGVTREQRVVVYEENSGMRATRVLWLLDLLGHPSARLLDGGVGAWRAAGLPLMRDAVEPETTSLAIERRPEHLATVADVEAALGRADAAIVDTRSLAEHTGAQVRAARGGAIPGSVHLEWTRNLTSDGRYRPAEELRAMYEAAGVMPEQEVITYCQGGYRAAQSWLALTIAGYPRVRAYLGSWNEWGNRLDLPIVNTAAADAGAQPKPR
jgi:thiosulfate/3-mercaptopyruvate sulfurtransferase